MSGHPEQVIMIIGHGQYWALRGIFIAMVEPTSDGVRIGVRSDPTAAEAELDDYYPFPVRCYAWSDDADDPHGEPDIGRRGQEQDSPRRGESGSPTGAHRSAGM
jgi:hypothetical protein